MNIKFGHSVDSFFRRNRLFLKYEGAFRVNTQFGRFMGSLVVVTAFFEVGWGRFE